MANVNLAMGWKQARIPGCIAVHATNSINKALLDSKTSTEYKASQLRILFGYFDSGVTPYGQPDYLTTKTGNNTTQLNISTARYNALTKEIVLARAKFWRLLKNDKFSNDYLLEQFSAVYWPQMQSGFSEFLAAWKDSERPANEVNKP